MSIECSHCGAMNPLNSMFCGECGWQIMSRAAELEAEQAVVTGRAKAGPADLKAQPEGEPAGREAGPEPEPVAISAVPEAKGAELEAGPDMEPTAIEAGPGPEPVALSVVPEAETAGLNAGQDAVYEATPGVLPSPAKVPYHDREGVTITGSAAIFGDRTYALEDITSVTMETSPANRLPSLLLAAFGAIILALAVASLGRDSLLGIVLIVGGLVLLVVGAVLVATTRDRYMVCVETASGVEAALVSPDREYVQRVVQAMRRGRSEQDLPEQA